VIEVDAHPKPGRLALDALTCAARTIGLLAQHRLHLRRARLGHHVALPDGRTFDVFRESSRDGDAGEEPVTLAVWFHLRGVPASGRLRRFLFERLCIINTLLFAGFDGYLVKLWMVDPVSADYAGIYSWRSASEAETYAHYITGVLAPISTPGSVGYQVLPDVSLDEYLKS